MLGILESLRNVAEAWMRFAEAGCVLYYSEYLSL